MRVIGSIFPALPERVLFWIIFVEKRGKSVVQIERSDVMRTIFLTTAALLVMCLINTVATASANGDGNAGYTVSNAYGAPACAAPAYCGPLVPGCCEYAPSCRCDDIWAGYCQEKEKGRGGCCRPTLCRPTLCMPAIPCPSFSWRWGWPHRAPQYVETCSEPACDQSPLAPAGNSAKPSPSVKPTPKAPPANPEPIKEGKKASSAWKPSGDWSFLPSVR